MIMTRSYAAMLAAEEAVEEACRVLKLAQRRLKRSRSKKNFDDLYVAESAHSEACLRLHSIREQYWTEDEEIRNRLQREAAEAESEAQRHLQPSLFD